MNAASAFEHPGPVRRGSFTYAAPDPNVRFAQHISDTAWSTKSDGVEVTDNCTVIDLDALD